MDKIIYNPNIDASSLLAEEEVVYHTRLSGSLPVISPSLKIIDLFCGAGGLTLGFTKLSGHSFIPVWANDFNDFACNTYNRNFGNHCVSGDIVDILSDSLLSIPDADIVIGGPPCQGFSLLNRNREHDPRKQLWVPYLDVVKRSNASVFVMENVPQLLDSPEYDDIVQHAKGMGFKICCAKLCAADYGVPQTRWRAFIIGCKFSDPSSTFPPKKTNFNPIRAYRKAFSEEFDAYIADPKPWMTVRNAISDLIEPVGTEIRSVKSPYDLHFGRTPTSKSLERYKAIPKEGMNRFDLQRIAPHLTPDCWIRKESGGTDLFGRLWWDRPSFTIRTEFFKPEKGRYLHPEQHRPITHREAARLQSFPDDFIFTGSKIEIARQIGNAVPPKLASRIADSVYALFQQRRIECDGCLLFSKAQLDNVTYQR